MLNYDKIVIKELLSEMKDLDVKAIYSLHEKYRIGPFDMAKAVNELIEKKIIEFSNNEIKLINIADENTLLSLKKYFFTEKPNLDRLDIEQSIESLEINKPYLPDISYLDINYFKLIDK